MSTPGTAARVPATPARTTRPAHPSRWPAGTLAAAGTIPGPPMNASATPVISAGHHPANYRSAIPARAYESGSGHGHDAAPAGHPHPGRSPPDPARRYGPPRPAASIIGSRRPASRAPAASPRRALRAPVTRAADRTTGAATRARGSDSHARKPGTKSRTKQAKPPRTRLRICKHLTDPLHMRRISYIRSQADGDAPSRSSRSPERPRPPLSQRTVVGDI
jgi:hypothetical protein